MEILRGSPALSPFRASRLLNTLKQQVPAIRSVYAEFLHFSDLSPDKAWSPECQRVLDRLLEYGPRRVRQEAEGQLFLVIPRPGTISPWSSKATDIAHNCGLTAIHRLERGIAYTIDSTLAPHPG